MRSRMGKQLFLSKEQTLGYSTYANRGKGLETLIEVTNTIYSNKKIAVVQKVPTPVKVTKTEAGGKVRGFWEEKSTVDFIGTFRGIPIAFDAKETKGKSFKLENAHGHQIDFMRRWTESGGISFLLICFTDYSTVYRLPYDLLAAYMKNPLKTNLKSIPMSFLEEHCYKFGTKTIPLDYLKDLEGEKDEQRHNQVNGC